MEGNSLFFLNTDGNQEFVARPLESGNHIAIQVSTGSSAGTVPRNITDANELQEWLKRYGLLASMGKAQKDHMRFSMPQVFILDVLLASQPEATCVEPNRR